MNKGIAYALFSYIFWGLLPIYWKQFESASSFEIVSQRILWGFVFFATVISFRKGWSELFAKIKKWESNWIIFTPALIIGFNWFIYIWAVVSGFIIETSLGYFISPLFSVFLGVISLKESLRRLQWIAVGIAAIGVLVMTVFYGQFPWVSVLLASTWAVYGLLRKKSPLTSVEGLTLESAILSCGALVYIIYLMINGTASFGVSTNDTLYFIGSGVVSGTPLLVFITAARMINLSLIGFLQYIYPTLIFVVGAFIYGESLTEAKMIGFVFIWIALFIYSLDGTYFLNKKRLAKAAK